MRKTMIVTVLALVMASAVPSRAIVGGTNAAEGQFPWTAAVYATPNPSNGQFCGGTLVHASLVVSAAHCVDSLIHNTVAALPGDPFRTIDPLGVRLRVMVGSRSLSASQGTHRFVRQVNPHPNESLDVAVLQLEAPVTSVTPIGYLTLSSDAAWDAPGVMATATGWGHTSEGGSGSNVLRFVEVPIISDADCRQVYSNMISSTEICAGYAQGGKDTCQGDSGGPLVVKRPNGNWILAGATSWGDGCARPGRPGVYAEMRVAAAFISSFIT